MNKVIIANSKDNVGTLTIDLAEGESVLINENNIESKHNIPAFHKMALANIEKGQPIIKYGEVIGLATTHIFEGEYVHVHNIESTRGRGDKEGGEI
jgi:altronate dehydratase small subunit